MVNLVLGERGGAIITTFFQEYAWLRRGLGIGLNVLTCNHRANSKYWEAVDQEERLLSEIVFWLLTLNFGSNTYERPQTLCSDFDLLFIWYIHDRHTGYLSYSVSDTFITWSYDITFVLQNDNKTYHVEINK